MALRYYVATEAALFATQANGVFVSVALLRRSGRLIDYLHGLLVEEGVVTLASSFCVPRSQLHLIVKCYVRIYSIMSMCRCMSWGGLCLRQNKKLVFDFLSCSNIWLENFSTGKLLRVLLENTSRNVLFTIVTHSMLCKKSPFADLTNTRDLSAGLTTFQNCWGFLKTHLVR